ncbi:MAG: MiaB/RimO family radical SAM methylthiotransferase [Acidobacteriota bacterium]
MKYSVITFGCRVNQADSLGFEEELRAGGATCDIPDRADIVIVNTCSVTASADQSARQTVRRLARTNPRAKVVVTGCYATRRPEEFRDAPNVLRVVANDEKPALVTLLATDFGLTSAQRFGDGDGSCGADIEPGVAGRTAFTLRVQTGCSQPCSYCIIPATRGQPRSAPITEILTHIAGAVAAGFKEIALTGVHLGSYGRDLVPPSSLIELLRAIGGRAGRGELPVRFRISSLEPMDCSREIVDLVTAGDSFAGHFHLPLQHASTRLLTAMRRPYTVEDYAALVDGIRARMLDASIGSDIIVGFPGERDEDFEALCGYLAHSPLTHLHVFPYSDRPGTEASSMSGKVPGGVIRARAARVRDIGHRLTSAFRQRQLGTIQRALTIGDGAVAVTGNYLKVRIAPGRDRNEWVRVKITESGESMSGQVLET